MIDSDVHLSVYDTFSDWEVGYLTAHLGNGDHHRQPGRFRVITVGSSRDPVTSMGGLRITPDVALGELQPDRSAMLVLPGATTWESGALAPFAEKAREFLAAGVPVAAVCGATFGLAAAGILDGRRHTSNAAEYLAGSGYAGGDCFVDAPAVTDRNLVTASGVAPVHFAREVFAKLEVYEPGVLASWFKVYGDRDPAGFFELMST